MKYKTLTSGLLLFFLQVLVFYFVFCYLFPFKEQVQMFQFTWQYATVTLMKAGGVAHYIAEFISQFYIVLGVGPVISAFLLTVIAMLSLQILRKVSMRNDLTFIGLLPWLSLFCISLQVRLFICLLCLPFYLNF